MESDSGPAGRVRRAGTLQLSITGRFPLMSEAELHLLRARLRGGILNQARRGELKMPLPVGLVYDPLGRVVLEPRLTYAVSSAVRGAVTGYMKLFADRYGRENIRMNNVLPGFLDNWPWATRSTGTSPWAVRAGSARWRRSWRSCSLRAPRTSRDRTSGSTGGSAVLRRFLEVPPSLPSGQIRENQRETSHRHPV